MCFFLSVPDANSDIVLVTPVWNDSQRLAGFGAELARSLAASDLNVTWVIADDGSGTKEVAQLDRLLDEFSEVYSDIVLQPHPQRSRKGGAIYQSWAAFPDYDYYAFVDADGAIAPVDVIRLLQRAVASDVADESFVAVRQLEGSLLVARSGLRKLSFHLFHGMVGALIGLKCADTQCGAKIISGNAYRVVEKSLRERGFVFDVELLLALQENGYRVKELEIDWLEKPGGKVSPLRDAWRMMAALFRIRWRWKAGAYRLTDL